MTDSLPQIVLPATSDATPITPPAAPMATVSSVPVHQVDQNTINMPATMNATMPSPSVSLQPVPAVEKTPTETALPTKMMAPEPNKVAATPMSKPQTTPVSQSFPSPDPLQIKTKPAEQKTVTATPEPAAFLPPQSQPAPILSTQSSSPTTTTTDLQAKEATLTKDLEKINQAENKLLGTIKDWIGWIQGAETKKQAIERELKALDKELQGTTSTTPTTPKSVEPAGPSLAELETHLHAAQSQFKTIQDQQKIEEKKAFDNYAAGGSNREGLMKEMERISALYSQPVTAAKAKILRLEMDIKKKLPNLESPVTEMSTSVTPTEAKKIEPPAKVMTPMPVPTPAPVVEKPADTQPATPAPTAEAKPSTPVTPPGPENILTRLRSLDQAQSGAVRQLLVDLPQQGQTLTLQRPAEGNGIIVLAGNETNYTLAAHFSDADLIRAGLGADDIATLPTGTLSAAQLHNPQ